MEFCKYRADKKCWKEGHFQFGKPCNDFVASICPYKENPYIEKILTPEKERQIYDNARKYGDV